MSMSIRTAAEPSTFLAQTAHMSLSQEEQDTYSACFQIGDLGSKGYQTPMETATMWKRSGLPQSTLSQIWHMIEKREDGNVGPVGFCQGMRLIASAQQLNPPDQATMLRQSLILPRLEGLDNSSIKASTPTSVRSSVFIDSPIISIPQRDDSTDLVLQYPDPEWIISSEDRLKYDGYFDSLDTERTGMLDQDRVFGFFLKSGLQELALMNILKLINYDQTFGLNKDKFAAGMHIIRKHKAGVPVPLTLSSSLMGSQPPVISRQSSNLSQYQFLPSSRQSMIFNDNIAVPNSTIQPGGVDTLRNQIGVLEGEIITMSRQKADTDFQVQALETEKLDYLTRLKALIEQKNDLTNALNSLQYKLFELQKEVFDLRERLKVEEAELNGLKLRKDTAENMFNHNRQAASQEITALSAALDQIVTQKQQVLDELKQLHEQSLQPYDTSQIETLKRKLEDSQTELRDLQMKHAATQELIQSSTELYDKERQDIEQRLASIDSEKTMLIKEISENRNPHVQDDIEVLKQRLQEQTSILERLKQQKEASWPFEQSVEEINRQKEELHLKLDAVEKEKSDILMIIQNLHSLRSLNTRLVQEQTEVDDLKMQQMKLSNPTVPDPSLVSLEGNSSLGDTARSPEEHSPEKESFIAKTKSETQVDIISQVSNSQENVDTIEVSVNSDKNDQETAREVAREELSKLGFSEQDIVHALDATDNDVKRAINYILDSQNQTSSSNNNDEQSNKTKSKLFGFMRK